ncbi:Methionine transport system substrate-binding protein [Candidatus Termititenax persephonae]|uniref:Methionine transport system substrate-binding protein n=1 Tax=Candidatus Termititenax persephonae TaxID=2218525 RepID=A0A388TIF9_9BACT|nr:Methionine transport system substrate-binding protein [Candidatus Termititenax persephonae]
MQNFWRSLILISVLLLAGCSPKAPKTTLTIGASPVPHAELLNLIKDSLIQDGIDLKIVEFTDYVMPNTALLYGDIDANFTQHLPYLNSNSEWVEKLRPAFSVHIEPFGLYSRRYQDIAALPDGATIAIPNDPTNGGRALLLLEAHKLIVLRKGAGLQATEKDIAVNPHKLQFRALEAAQLPRTLSNVDAAAINGNYALDAGLNPVQDSLIIEGAQSPYVNIVAVRRGQENDPRIVALRQALLSPKVKKHIEETYNGGVVAVF